MAIDLDNVTKPTGSQSIFDLELTKEQVAIQRMVRDFTNRRIKPIALERDSIQDQGERIPWDVLKEASRLGLRTLALSRENGGGGADTLTCCIVTEELAVGDAGIAATIDQAFSFAHTWFDRAMTPEQRDRFLPDFLADANYYLAFCSHEPDTDMGYDYFTDHIPNTGYKTTAAQDSRGYWVINGAKNFQTNATIAKLLVVMAQTEKGPSAFLVPASTPGISRRPVDKVGRRLGDNAELFFNDVRVPPDHILGEPGKPAGGLGMGIGIGVGTPRFSVMALGIARAAYEAAVEFAKRRIQGGKPIIQHQLVGLALADMAVNLEVARTMNWKAAWACDHPEALGKEGVPDLPLGLMAKLFTSKVGFDIAVRALQLFGGMGILTELPMQKYVRDAVMFFHQPTMEVGALRIAEAVAGYQRSSTRTRQIREMKLEEGEL